MISAIHFQKLRKVLRPSQRRQALVLFGLMIVSMALETVGVGMILPVLALIAEPDIGARFPAVTPLLKSLGNPSQTELVVGALVALGIFFAIKNGFLAYMTWRKAGFVTEVQADLSQRLFTGYLRQPYTFHLQHNSAQLIRNINAEVTHFFNGLNSLVDLLTQLIILLSVTALLLWAEPLGGLVVFAVLGGAGMLLHQITKTKLSRWGAARQFHDVKRIQHLQQGLGGVKDVKLLGREDDFLAQFAVHIKGNASIERKRILLGALPKLSFEFLAVIGMVALILTMLAQGKPIEVLIPTVALFAAAAFRLLPNIGSVMLHVQTLRFVGPVIDNLHAEISLLENTPHTKNAAPLAFHEGIELHDVAFRYAGAARLALTKISLQIPRGATVGFIGGSGAGKSTLIDVILGLLAPTRGKVLADGTDIQTNLRGWQDQIGYVPQSIFLSDDSLRRNIAFGLPEDQIDDLAVERAIKASQLEEFVAGLPEGLHTAVGERGVRLSGGQRQRIGIARALYHDPQILVLDEATSALDVATEEGVMQAVRALHGAKTILIVAHRLSTVANCDKLYRLEKGGVVQEGAFLDVVGLEK